MPPLATRMGGVLANDVHLPVALQDCPAAQSPPHNTPDAGSEPHSRPLQLFASGGHSPHSERTVPQSVAAGMVHCFGRQTLEPEGKPRRGPWPIAQKEPGWQSKSL